MKHKPTEMVKTIVNNTYAHHVCPQCGHTTERMMVSLSVTCEGDGTPKPPVDPRSYVHVWNGIINDTKGDVVVFNIDELTETPHYCLVCGTRIPLDGTELGERCYECKTDVDDYQHLDLDDLISKYEAVNK